MDKSIHLLLQREMGYPCSTPYFFALLDLQLFSFQPLPLLGLIQVFPGEAVNMEIRKIPLLWNLFFYHEYFWPNPYESYVQTTPCLLQLKNQLQVN